MTAAASLRDSSSVLEADLGKGRVMPQRTAACLPLPLHPSPKRQQGAEPPSKSHTYPYEVSHPKPLPHRTTRRHALGISAAGVASVTEAISVSGHAHANLVQFGYAPREPSALPVEPIDQGAFHIPLEPSTAPVRMVCSGTASA